MLPRKRQLIFFGIAGCLGFVIEAITIYSALNYLHLDPYTPRLISYPVACSVTWYINRRFGFRVTQKPTLAEFFRFIKSNMLSQLVNLILYFSLISVSGNLAESAIFVLIFATFVSMMLSLFLYKNYVFS